MEKITQLNCPDFDFCDLSDFSDWIVRAWRGCARQPGNFPEVLKLRGSFFGRAMLARRAWSSIRGLWFSGCSVCGLFRRGGGDHREIQARGKVMDRIGSGINWRK